MIVRLKFWGWSDILLKEKRNEIFWLKFIQVLLKFMMVGNTFIWYFTSFEYIFKKSSVIVFCLIYLFYLFIFGSVGSSLLRVGFL